MESVVVDIETGEESRQPLTPEEVADAEARAAAAVVYVGEERNVTRVRTTDAAPTEVFRRTTLPKHLYRGTFSMLAIDAGNGVSKDVEARISFKQVGGAAAQVGSTVVMSQIQDTAAASWAIQGASDGADFVVSVRGAAGRTIDWALTGHLALYAPEGLTSSPTG